MTKTELIERIMDSLIDPWTDCPEDYIDATFIDTHEAQDLLDQIRDDEDKMDLEPEDRLPAEITPELIMIAYNCNIRKNRHELTVERLAEYITDNEMVCEYANYKDEYLDNPLVVLPTEFLDDDYMAYFATDGVKYYATDLIHIGMNSVNSFNRSDTYCWFDAEKMQLFSSDTPFADGILDAKAFAEYILSDEGQDCLDYFIECIMDAEDFRKVFGYEKEE